MAREEPSPAAVSPPSADASQRATVEATFRMREEARCARVRAEEMCAENEARRARIRRRLRRQIDRLGEPSH